MEIEGDYFVFLPNTLDIFWDTEDVSLKCTRFSVYYDTVYIGRHIVDR